MSISKGIESIVEGIVALFMIAIYNPFGWIFIISFCLYINSCQSDKNNLIMAVEKEKTKQIELQIEKLKLEQNISNDKSENESTSTNHIQDQKD